MPSHRLYLPPQKPCDEAQPERHVAPAISASVPSSRGKSADVRIVRLRLRRASMRMPDIIAIAVVEETLVEVRKPCSA